MKHTKKVIIAALALVIVLITTLALTACSKDIYGGNFAEVTDEVRINQILEDIEAFAENPDWSGVKTTTDTQTIASIQGIESTTTSKGTGYILFGEINNMQMSINSSVTTLGQKMVLNTYLKDNVMYTDTKMGQVSNKSKMSNYSSHMEEAQNFLPEGLLPTETITIDFLFDQLNSLLDAGFKISATAETGKRNIKISSINSSDKFLEIILSLDAAGKVKGIKMNADMDMSLLLGNMSLGENIFMRMKGYFIYEPFSGTIKFPSDLDSYPEYDTLFPYS